MGKKNKSRNKKRNQKRKSNKNSARFRESQKSAKKKGLSSQSRAVIYVLVFAAVIGGVFGLYSILSEKYLPVSDVVISENAVDDFVAIDQNGNKVKLSNYFGKPIVLNFWASWCYYCRVEMPHFEEAYKNNPDVQFLMVNVTDGYDETMHSATALIEQNGYTFPVLFDTEGDGAQKYNAYSLPITYFIDETGELVTYHSGMMNAQMLEAAIDKIK